MYIQLVNYCNMSCSHCCMSATSKGSDMSLETFRNALKLDNGYISIGGGEPTLHPLFWQMLMEAVAVSEGVWLATNGSQTEISIALAGLAKKGVLGVALSLDKFHDPISDEVMEAFQGDYRKAGDWVRDENDKREIRNTEKNLIKSGRCKTGKIGCCCPDLFVKPDGTVKGCGCRNAKVFGNVNTEVIIPDSQEEYTAGECSVHNPNFDIKPVKYENVEIVDGVKL